MNSDFCHLHVHNEYSQLDGYGTAKQYVDKAHLLGFKYLGLTNHGNIDGLIKFQKECDEKDILPILGCEAYIVQEADKKRERGHICLFVKNQRGFRNLCKMMTYANMEGFYYKPRITYDILLKHCQGLVISTACAASFLKLNGGRQLFSDLYDSIGDDLYLEVMPVDLEMQRKLNQNILKLSRKFGSKIIVTNDCHYVNMGEYIAQEVLLAIGQKSKWTDENRWKFTIKGLHLRTKKEMIRAFEKYHPGFLKKSYLTNTIEVAEKCCNFRIKKKEIELPHIKDIVGSDEVVMKRLCYAGFKRLFEKDLKKDKIYFKRFKMEYNLIKNKKFIRYFLIVWELLDWCRNNDILVSPLRGSVGGSLVAYLLGITAVDPIYHDLLFDRFINKDRIDYPDIDIDFEDTKRIMVRKHLEDTYGEENVAGVSSYNRMQAKSVIRDVGRVFEIPYKEVDEFAKLIEDGGEEGRINEAIENFQEGKEFARKHPFIIKMAKKLEGQVRGYGQHAAALVISKRNIGKGGRCNLLSRDDGPVVNWEKEDTEYVGLMKLDALGLKQLSILSETKRLIKENYGKNIILETIDIKDEKVLKEISEGNTVGVFQMNTWAMTHLIKEMEANTFEELVAATALVRPGPSHSGMTEEYIKRKHGTRWKLNHDIYDEITKDTYGILVYQEQVMQVIYKMAGLPYSIADKIRKIIGKKRDPKEFKVYKNMFVKGCLKKGTFSKKEANQFWKGLLKWAKYGFNKSHSVGYAMLGYWCAWLRYYYPTEFICGSLTYGAEKKRPEIMEEAYRLGLSLILPKVGISEAFRWVAKDKKLYVPFIEVKGLGKVKAKQAARGDENKNDIRKFYIKDKQKIGNNSDIKGAFRNLLNEIGAFDLNEHAQLPKSVKKYFKFRIATSTKSQYKNLMEIGEKNIRLDRIDKVLSGDYKEIEKLKLKISNKKFKGFDNELSNCKACSLIKQCKKPVHPSPGKFNVAIIGEGPGPKEDEKGKGFLGKSGDLLWKRLKKKGFRRKQFHVTNMVKCYPKITRTPNEKQIRLCGNKWLKKELQELKPILMLVFGNTGLKYFTNLKNGITQKSGSTIWSEEFKCWIAWCVHPSSVLHNKENEIYFDSGINNFTKLLRILLK